MTRVSNYVILLISKLVFSFVGVYFLPKQVIFSIYFIKVSYFSRLGERSKEKEMYLLPKQSFTTVNLFSRLFHKLK